MATDTNLKRFIDAQENSYASALTELNNGRKTGHWMWYIFPQVQGLGFSETSRYYGINNLQEAKDYLNHPILGSRLIEICKVLLALKSSDATRIFGTPDDLKLKSSMTLFASIPDADPVFQQVLQKFYAGSTDTKTLRIINAQP